LHLHQSWNLSFNLRADCCGSKILDIAVNGDTIKEEISNFGSDINVLRAVEYRFEGLIDDN
jgi:hypothetical protein